MPGIVQELLRLEGAKHQALLESDAAAYDAHVRAQLDIFDSSPAFVLEAKQFPQQLEILSRLMHLNTKLFLNLMSASPVLALSSNAYSSVGSLETHFGHRFSTEA